MRLGPIGPGSIDHPLNRPQDRAPQQIEYVNSPPDQVHPLACGQKQTSQAPGSAVLMASGSNSRFNAVAPLTTKPLKPLQRCGVPLQAPYPAPGSVELMANGSNNLPLRGARLLARSNILAPHRDQSHHQDPHLSQGWKQLWQHLAHR